MTSQDVLELRKYLTVTHHDPGSIRLKVDTGILSHPAAKESSLFADNVKESEALISYRLNIITRTISLEYDTRKVAPQTLDALFTSHDQGQVLAAAKEVADLLGIQLS